jgi:hypothetical protein
MRRRENSIAASSGNLLLDTLCNALGGILFIALLVVLVAHQVPVLEAGDPQPPIPDSQLKDLESKLLNLPTQKALKAQRRSYDTALAEFAESGLKPIPSEVSQEALVRDRNLLSALPDANKQAPASYRVPAIRKTQNLQQAYIAIFRSGEVFAAPLSAELLIHNGKMVIDNLHFRRSSKGIIQIEPEGAGMNVGMALRALDNSIRTKAAIPAECKLYLYAYADSIEVFQNYRKQAMRRMPNAIWYGLVADDYPRLLLSGESQSNTIFGF